MNTTYAIDLSLKPTTFDLWHVCLASTVVLLSLILIALLLAMVVSLVRCKNRPKAHSIQQTTQDPEPVVKIVEKIVEVEKLVYAPVPEPVILKESTPDAALQLLALLQKDARFIDFIKEDISSYSDADVGVVARVVHEGCNKTINEHFSLGAIRSEEEGAEIALPQGFDASAVRLTGNVVGSAPFKGTLLHRGWQVTDVRLAKLTQGHNAKIIAAAEVEL